MALSTQTDLEQTFQISFVNPTEPVVALLLQHAQDVIETYLDRTLAETLGTVETLDGDRQHMLFLRNWPVLFVGQVVEDGTALTQGDDYLWYPDGRLVRGSDSVDLLWTWKRQSVVVDYNHGYPTIPTRIAYVSTMIAGRIFQSSAAYANASPSSSGIRRIDLSGSDMVEYSDAVSNVAATIGGLQPFERDILSRERRVDF